MVNGEHILVLHSVQVKKMDCGLESSLQLEQMQPQPLSRQLHLFVIRTDNYSLQLLSCLVQKRMD
ncbi:hypothetical protein D3C80_1893410 [compost metagenome]